MTTKVCGKCKTEKPLDDFHMSRHHSYGRCPRCKACSVRTGEKNSWEAMRHRCKGLRADHKKYYADRGITVCHRWQNSFDAFLADMGTKPTPQHQIDRIDNDGNYEPSNCRWATRSTQERNSRNCKLSHEDIPAMFKMRGHGLPYSRIAAKFGCAPTTVVSILKGKKWKDISLPLMAARQAKS